MRHAPHSPYRPSYAKRLHSRLLEARTRAITGGADEGLRPRGPTADAALRGHLHVSAAAAHHASRRCGRGVRRPAVRHRRELPRRGALRAQGDPRGIAVDPPRLQHGAARRACSSASRRSTTATPRWCPGFTDRSYDKMAQALRTVHEAGAVPIGFGGDHSVLLAELRAAAATHGPLALHPVRRAQRHLGRVLRREVHARHGRAPRHRRGADRRRALHADGHARRALRPRRPRRGARAGVHGDPVGRPRAARDRRRGGRRRACRRQGVPHLRHRLRRPGVRARHRHARVRRPLVDAGAGAAARLPRPADRGRRRRRGAPRPRQLAPHGDARRDGGLGDPVPRGRDDAGRRRREPARRLRAAEHARRRGRQRARRRGARGGGRRRRRPPRRAARDVGVQGRPGGHPGERRGGGRAEQRRPGAAGGAARHLRARRLDLRALAGARAASTTRRRCSARTAVCGRSTARSTCSTPSPARPCTANRTT